MPHLHVLVVEDDAGIREIVCTILEEAGYRVTSARDGEEGLRLIRSITFDIVVTDHEMPELTGLEMLDRAVAEGRLGHTKVLILTAYAAMMGQTRFKVLAKPFEVTALLRALADERSPHSPPT